MQFLQRILLSVILCSVTLFNVSGPDFQRHVYTSGTIVSADDEFDDQQDAFASELQYYCDPTIPNSQGDAARIHQRYHERLAAFFTAFLATIETRLPAVSVSDAVICGIRHSSECLSSCYDFIFRLCLF